MGSTSGSFPSEAMLRTERYSGSGSAALRSNPKIGKFSGRLDLLMRSLGRDVPEIRQEITDADREALRALGYADESSDTEEEAR